jgi:predicted MPP superfamily phosphohydrolase
MDIDIIQQENNELKEKVKDLEEKLKKYTNGDNHKRYYEKNKDKIKEQGATYLKKLKDENPEKLKEYRRKYYLKKKEEMQNKDK